MSAGKMVKSAMSAMIGPLVSPQPRRGGLAFRVRGCSRRRALARVQPWNAAAIFSKMAWRASVMLPIPPTTARAIIAAIKPYATAVAPDSSRINPSTRFFTAFPYPELGAKSAARAARRTHSEQAQARSAGDGELGFDGGERARQTVGEIPHGDDQACRDQRRDQPIFDGGRAGLVVHETVHKMGHGCCSLPRLLHTARRLLPVGTIIGIKHALFPLS